MKKINKYLIIFSSILLSRLLPSCDFSDSENYNRVIIDSTSIYMVNIENDSITKIIDGENPMFIPNSNRILYRSIDKIYSFDLVTNQIRYIADMPGARIRVTTRLNVSENGQYVSYTARGYNNTSDLFVASLIMEGNINLTKSANSSESEGIFFSNDSKLLFYESIGGYFDSCGTSTIDLFGDNYSFLTPYQYPIGFSVNDRYCIIKSSWSTPSSTGTIIYTYDMDLNKIVDSLVLDQQIIFDEPNLSDDMKLYYSSNESNFYMLDLVTKQINLLWTGTTSMNYKFSPDFKKVLIIQGNYLKLVNLETNQTRIYLIGDVSLNVFFDNPCFSKDCKSFLITRYYHDEKNN